MIKIFNKRRFRKMKRRALRFHHEDGKQYHVIWNEDQYIIVSRESLKHHNKIAKKKNEYKKFTYLDVCKKALYSTPTKTRVEL